MAARRFLPRWFTLQKKLLPPPPLPPSTTLDPNTPPPIKMQTADQPTIAASTSPKDELNTSSPSSTATKPASPSHWTPQSKSPPPLPSSPSQSRSTTSLSPSHKQIPLCSPVETQPPNSPSNESTQIIAYQAQVISDSAAHGEINGVDDTSLINNEVRGTSTSTEPGNTTPLSTAQSTDQKHITSNGKHEPLVEPNANHEETKDVKEEVVQATKTEAHEETKKEVNGLNSKSVSQGPIIEKSEIPSKQPDEVHTEKQDTHNKSTQTSKVHVSLNQDIRGDISTLLKQISTGGDPKGKNTISDRNMSIITLAGENRGASMQIGSTSLKEVLIPIHRGYKINPYESAEKNTAGEGSSKGKRFEDGKVTKGKPIEAYVNNNAQGINNSIVFNTSIEGRNPGVHIVTHVRKKPIHLAEKKSLLQTESGPTVKRRCLRGLFMESSESDLENTKKPRSHGCRVGCNLKEKDVRRV